MVGDGVIKRERSVPVRDLMCFLARAFPIEPVSMMEVMVLKGKVRMIKGR